MILEAFAMTLRNLLRVPLGASLRKNYGTNTVNTGQIAFEDNDYVQAILQITTDDICIGDNPLSVDYKSSTPDEIIKKLEQIRDEFNSIVKWATKDLLMQGFSLYRASVDKSKNKLILLPYNKPVEFYLTKDKRVAVFDASDGVLGSKRKSLTDLVVFINYEKSSLLEVEDKEFSKFAYKLEPTPMQFNKAASTVDKITSAENSIAKARAQLGRIPRWANVDVGTASGDTQTNVVNEISSAINANSEGLSGGTAFTEFDDNIPVIPNRNGKGKPELEHDAVDVNIRELKDLDYFVGKLGLLASFPATYLDYTQNLDSTAVSLIRGDIRYAKKCSSVRSKVEKTINDYIQSSQFKDYDPVFSLTKLPTSEDSDVMQSLDDYVDTSVQVEQFVMGEGDSTKESKLFRLELLKDLLQASTNSPALQKWFEDYRSYIVKDSTSDDEAPDVDLDRESSGGEDVEVFEEGLSPEDYEEEEEVGTIPEPPEGEFIEPQTE